MTLFALRRMSKLFYTHLDAQFLEQPDPGTVFVLVQDQVTLTCSIQERYGIDWEVSLVRGTGPQRAAGPELEQWNFSLEGLLTNKSTLSLWETVNKENNGANITCLALDMSFYWSECF